MEKRTSPENKLALKRVLAQEGNGRCADCKTATHPRWASWNIGILICIRCSGIHRSLGTHISKVRSIDLDTWNDQQLEKLLAYGNTRANAYWEAKLKPGYIPDEAKIANFIKTKYELKRWIPEDDDTPLADMRPGLPPRVRPPAENASAAVRPAQSEPPQGAVDLLDLDGAFNVRSKPTTSGPSRLPVSPSSLISHLGVGHHSHHHHSHHHSHHHEHHSHHLKFPGQNHQQQPGRPMQSQSHQGSPQPAVVQPPPRPASQPPRSDIKKSILALYTNKQPEKPLSRSPGVAPATSSNINSTSTSASASTSTIGNTSGNASASVLAGSLSGVSFAPSSTASPSLSHQSEPQQPAALSNSSTPSARFDHDFDDESFANVWQR